MILAFFDRKLRGLGYFDKKLHGFDRKLHSNGCWAVTTDGTTPLEFRNHKLVKKCKNNAIYENKTARNLFFELQTCQI